MIEEGQQRARLQMQNTTGQCCGKAGKRCSGKRCSSSRREAALEEGRVKGNSASRGWGVLCDTRQIMEWERGERILRSTLITLVEVAGRRVKEAVLGLMEARRPLPQRPTEQPAHRSLRSAGRPRPAAAAAGGASDEGATVLAVPAAPDSGAAVDVATPSLAASSRVGSSAGSAWPAVAATAEGGVGGM